MEQLAKLKDSVLGYFSPKRTNPDSAPDSKRRRTFGPGTPSKDPAGEHAYAPMSDPRDEKARAALYGRANMKHSPSGTKNPLKRSRDEPLDGEEDDTELTWVDHEEDTGSLSPEDSSSQLAHYEEGQVEVEEQADAEDQDEVEDQDEDEVEYAEEDDLEPPVDEDALARDKVQEYLARQAELALRKEAIEEVKQRGDWHEDEVFLFERLSMRSYEALLPKDWQIDFKTLPDELFNDREQVLINHNHSPSYHGVKALQALFTLGLRVRECPHDFKATKYIEKALKDYTKWTEKDGDYFNKRFIPVLASVTAKPHHSTDRISKNITKQMQFLAQKHRDFLALAEPRPNEDGEVELYKRPPPLLYGIIIAQTIAMFVTLDSSNPEAKLRHIAHFDFKEPKIHVWNGVSLAIICVLARNYMMSVKDEFEDEEESFSDPDA